ncbi:hypothetical protein [Halomonas caseinilytica]|uniref:Uncharacterized protein n=1 Tax=Halomonas caseinilytica TaxID=438744 RepID=A0A1M7BA42_9GAMM|nr:hypothetical protein [Halomonas caseinilytica]SHL51804.1 hypothetical protein SAMN05192556_1202 [Halomonas caseinilytica]
MLQPKMVKEILEEIGKGEYVGTPLGDLYRKFVGEDVQGADENTYRKFLYHMDEMFDAGLFKCRDLNERHRWGKSNGIGNGRSYTNVNLLLTPLGAEALQELSKPKGFEKLVEGMRTAGTMAGQEALKYAIKFMFNSAL